MDYQQVIAHLQRAYSRESAGSRDQAGKEDWKVAERQQFLDLLRPGSLATNVKRQVPFGYFVNLEQVMAALRRIAQDGKHILPTHDPEVYTLYPDGIE